MAQALRENSTFQPRARGFEPPWPALLYGLVVFGAALMLLVLVASGAPRELDRLLPTGESFLPYFTT